MKKIILLLSLMAFIANVSAVNLTVEVLDEDSNSLNSDLILEDSNGDLVQENSTLMEAEINAGNNYTLTQQLPNRPDVKIHNLSTQTDLEFRPVFHFNERPDTEFLALTDDLYYVNQDFSFSKATISSDRVEPNRVAKCTSFSSSCDQWQVNSTTDLETSYNNGVFQYNVTSFSGYTTGTTAPKPVIENLEIFNVTGVQDKRTSGNLIDQGLNKTFEINQSNSKLYRFSFNISNQGSDSWNLTSQDNISHKGLNSSWNMNDIYLNISGSVYDGGNFSSGVVNWTTENGEIPENDSFRAEYVVNITQESTSTYDQKFQASTSKNTSDSDEHDLEVLKFGLINATIERPENNSVLQNNHEFNLNGTVECIEGDCGSLTAESRRNSSTGMNSIDGQFFDILDSNSTCTLSQNEVCAVEWDINASGDENTVHELDFKVNSSYEEVDTVDTLNSIVEIRDVLLMDLDWNTTNFGTLDPGQENRNASENNAGGYNLTIKEDSNTVDNLWLKGTDLVHSNYDSYKIGIGNMSYAEINDAQQSTNLTENYSLIDTGLSPGTVKTFYYWLDVPYGILRGDYTGTITFKANQTQ